jgi:hypothetical protein
MFRRLFALLLAVTCAACTSGSGAPEPGSTAPLPTTASGPLVCGAIPESTVKALLGHRKYEIGGGGVVRRPDGSLVGAACWLWDPDRPGSHGNYIEVSTRASVDRRLLRDVYTHAWDYTFPAEIGLGAAQHETSDGAVAALQWGDFTLTASIQDSGRGRDPVKDAVALVQQFGDALRISKTPKEPYPTRAELLATPSPNR